MKILFIHNIYHGNFINSKYILQKYHSFKIYIMEILIIHKIYDGNFVHSKYV